MSTLREAFEALAELVMLKDGPRDADYERRKPLAWERARSILAAQAANDGESLTEQATREAKREALTEAADECEDIERIGNLRSADMTDAERARWTTSPLNELFGLDWAERPRVVVTDWLRDRAEQAGERS